MTSLKFNYIYPDISSNATAINPDTIILSKISVAKAMIMTNQNDPYY